MLKWRECKNEQHSQTYNFQSKRMGRKEPFETVFDRKFQKGKLSLIRLTNFLYYSREVTVSMINWKINTSI